MSLLDLTHDWPALLPGQFYQLASLPPVTSQMVRVELSKAPWWRFQPYQILGMIWPYLWRLDRDMSFSYVWSFIHNVELFVDGRQNGLPFFVILCNPHINFVSVFCTCPSPTIYGPGSNYQQYVVVICSFFPHFQQQWVVVICSFFSHFPVSYIIFLHSLFSLRAL